MYKFITTCDQPPEEGWKYAVMGVSLGIIVGIIIVKIFS